MWSRKWFDASSIVLFDLLHAHVSPRIRIAGLYKRFVRIWASAKEIEGDRVCFKFYVRPFFAGPVLEVEVLNSLFTREPQLLR